MKPVIYGCETFMLQKHELDFFKEVQPFGFILFARNIDHPEQVKQLVKALKASVEHENVPILIDQEGGRVMRLKAPHWIETRPAHDFSKLSKLAPEVAEQALYTNYRLIGQQLLELGINVNCAPLLDIYHPDAHDIIGDRALGVTAPAVIDLASTVIDGLKDSGVLPVIKHIPGHGRAMVDSHLSLPIIDTSLPELEQSDFLPFKAYKSCLFAMTAHIVFNAIDDQNPVTFSKDAIKIIRDNIGFDGLIMTDDLSMKALTGSFESRAKRSLDAGCDIILHCNGDMNEMQDIATNLPDFPTESYASYTQAINLLPEPQIQFPDTMEDAIEEAFMA